MAINNEINISLKAIDKTSSTFQSIGNNAKGLSNKLSGLTGPLSGVTEGLKTATKYLAGLGTVMVGFGLKSAGQLEQTRIAFENLYGSADQAGKTIKDLTNFAAKTPFEMPEIADMALKLKNVAGITDDQLIPSLTKLGDIASSQGKSLSQSVEAFLDATTGEFERLKEFGIKAQQSGDKVSFTFRGQTETVEKTSEAIGGYLAKVGEMQGIQGGMEKQSTTLNGLFSSFKDTVSGLTRNLVGLSDTGEVIKGGLLDKVKVGLQDLSVWIETNKTKIKEFGEKVVEVGTIIGGYLLNIGKWIIDNQELIKWLGIIAVTLGTVSLAITTISGLVTTFTTLITGATIAIKGIGIALSFLAANPIGILVIAITGLIAVIALWIKNWDDLKLTILYLAGLIKDGVVTTFTSMKESIIQIGSDIYYGFIGFIDNLVNGIKDKMEAVMTYVKKKVQQAKDLMASIGGQLSTSIENFGANVKTLTGLDGTKANGGPVNAGGSYLVGERGPELFTPKQSGTVSSNGGFSGSININMGGVVISNDADENRLVEKIKKALINDAKLYNIGIS